MRAAQTEKAQHCAILPTTTITAPMPPRYMTVLILLKLLITGICSTCVRVCLLDKGKERQQNTSTMELFSFTKLFFSRKIV